MAWRYPFPRTVAAVAVLLPPGVASRPGLDLFRFDPGPGDFLACLLRFSLVPDPLGRLALLATVQARPFLPHLLWVKDLAR